MKKFGRLFSCLFVCMFVLMIFGSVPIFADHISIQSIRKTYGDSPFTLGVTYLDSETVTYSSNNKKVVTVDKSGKVTIKGCGIAKIVITKVSFVNDSKRVSSIKIIVKPRKAEITSLKSEKRNITIKWKRDKKADGYYVYYSTDKKLKKDLYKIKVSTNKATYKKIKKLKSGKKYYFKVCAYKKSGKEMVYGDFSKVISCKVK